MYSEPPGSNAGLSQLTDVVQSDRVNSWTRAVEAAHVGTLAALAAVVVYDPTARFRRAPDWTGWLTGQQRVDRVMSRLGPPLFLSTTAAAAAAALLAATRHQVPLAAGRAMATACTAASIAVTLTVNEPLNAQIRAWEPTDEPPTDWRSVRAGWDQAHHYRRVLVAAATLASVAGWVGARR